MIKELGTADKYHIFIGMNDREKLQQLVSTEDFVRIVQETCEDYQIAFSLHEQVGGYMMANGTFVHENSLVLSIAGFTQEQIFKLAEKLRILLNQEAIVVTLDRPQMFILTD